MSGARGTRRRPAARRAPLGIAAAALATAALGVGADAAAQEPAAREPATEDPGRPAQAAPFDLLIEGGRVMDGTGNPWFRADVGVRDGRIASIGALSDAAASRRIDASGKLVLPGFIDIHSHADDAGSDGGLRDDDPRRRAAPNLVAQGITTVIVNQDGRSPWPIAEQRRIIEAKGIGPNAGLMVGHNSIRDIALGDDPRREATPAEVDSMRRMVRRGMEAGAFGLSAGLEYFPGRWSTTDEVVALVGEVAPYGGVYIVHERSSGATPMWWWPSRHEPGPPDMRETILEDIEVAERTGVPTVATHIKARGADFWGSGRALAHFIERARARGVPIYADQYPYNTTGSDGSTVLLPDWLLDRAREVAEEAEEDVARAGAGAGAAGDTAAAGGDEEAGGGEGEGDDEDDDQGEDGPRPDYAAALEAALAVDSSARAVRRDIAHEITRRGGPPNLVVMEYPDSALVGKTLAELAGGRGLTPVEMAIRLQREGDPHRAGGGRIRGFSLSEIDVEIFAPHPWVATASDAGIALPGDGPVHARFYGTFPRKLREYAMDRGVLSVEDAVRSATSLPAQILGLEDRGLLREGFRADVVVLDPARIRDRATFFEPHQYPEGIELVLVNGTPVVDGGELTWALPGRVLTPPPPDGGGARR